MNFKIDRSRWSRGEPDSALLRERDGKMCCLGFFLKACGLSDKEITGHTEPQHPFECGDPDEILPEAEFLIVVDEDEDEDEELDRVEFAYSTSDDAASLMSLNDDPGMKDVQREERIAKVFAKHGHEVAFVEGVHEKANGETKGTER